jgi:hypothetical protein
MMYLEFYSAQVKKRADWEAERKAETRNRWFFYETSSEGCINNNTVYFIIVFIRISKN